MHDLVDLVGCDAGSECGCSNIQYFSGQPTHFAHLLLSRGVKQIYLIRTQRTASLGNTIGGIVRVRYRLGNLSLLGKRINRPERTSEREGRKGVEEPGLWIRFRHYFRREEGVVYTVFLLVRALVCALCSRVVSMPSYVFL